ncbi:MAG: hypothetical protein MJZ45_01865 [Bacteroidales bacterium]|nr:hypothetical protein [Bacteroidales bacterium]
MKRGLFLLLGGASYSLLEGADIQDCMIVLCGFLGGVSLNILVTEMLKMIIFFVVSKKMCIFAKSKKLTKGRTTLCDGSLSGILFVSASCKGI